MAKAVVHRGADGQLLAERVGDWIPYKGGNVHITESMTVAHDEFEGIDNGAGGLAPGQNDAYGAHCFFNGQDMGGSRWFFGNGYEPGYRYNDMPCTAGSAGKESDHIAIGFYCEFDSVNDFEYFVFTTENFPQFADPVALTGANDAATRGDYPGIVYSYGALPNGGGSYYYSDIDLSGSGLTHHIPNGANGGTLLLMGDVDQANNTIALVGQEMLWGIKSLNPTPQQIGAQWDDDNPADLVFDDGTNSGLNELYDYTYGLCPDPLGCMIGFYYTPGTTTETLAPTGFTLNLGKNSNNGTVANLGAKDGTFLEVCKFFVPNFASPFVRMTCTYTTTKTNPTAIELDCTARMHAANFGSFGITGYMHNFSGSGSNDKVFGESSINTTFADYSGTASGTLTNYVSGTTMQSMIEVRQTGPSTVVLPCADFDAVTLKVTG